MHRIPTMQGKTQTSIFSFLRVVTTAMVITVGGCAQTPRSSDTAEREYNADSWRGIIESSCRSFFDGCNTCASDLESGRTECTDKTCAQYERPECLDTPVQPRKIQFHCDNNKSFKVFYGEYTIGDKRISLDHNQAVFVDGANRIAEIMTQRPSTSGQKFASGDLVLWTLIDEAVLNKGNDVYYSNCSAALRVE